MRHNKKINHLGRTSSHRQAILSNMASSLIKHKRIFTTTAKAKALRKYVEPLVTKSKEDTTHSRRVVFSLLQDKYAVTELFTVVSQKVGDRPGGYTRIIKTGNRLGDNAAMCFIELVDFNENMLKETKRNTAKTRRSRRKSAGGDIIRTEKSVAPVEEVEAPVEAEFVEEIAEEQTVTEESQEENKAAE
jgi:large subunit ribosomal protein L17